MKLTAPMVVSPSAARKVIKGQEVPAAIRYARGVPYKPEGWAFGIRGTLVKVSRSFELVLDATGVTLLAEITCPAEFNEIGLVLSNGELLAVLSLRVGLQANQLHHLELRIED